MWSKGSNLTSLLLIKIFAEVVVNAEAPNINSCQPQQNIAKEKPRQNVFSYSYLCIIFAVARNAEL